MEKRLPSVGLVFFVASVILCIVSVMNSKQNLERDVSATFTKEYTKLDKNTKKPPPLIFYTRTPKCGGRSFREIIFNLSRRNKFRVHGYRDKGRRPPFQHLVEIVQNISRMEPPGIFLPLLHFINFQKYGLKQPTMIGLIRDPAEQFVSYYYFQIYGDRTGKHDRSPDHLVEDINECIRLRSPRCNKPTIFEIGGYFCGQDSLLCTTGCPESVAIAKRHIDENYMFIGITEEFDTTVRIFEKILPYYFEGAEEIWNGIKNNITKSTATKTRADLQPDAKAILQNMLKYEYEVYYHAKKKFIKIKKDLGID